MPGTHPVQRNPGWSFRGYLPHFDAPERVQSLSFRLGDAVPMEVLEKWWMELGFHEAHFPPDHPKQVELRRRIAVYEDAGHGECLLREEWVAQMMRDALLHFDGQHYKLLAWCIMPNHIHALIETVDGHAVSDVVKTWKNYPARRINAKLGRTGALWMADFFDRYIRNAAHLADAIAYIEGNPVKARLCLRSEEWRFGSSGHACARERGTPVPLD